MPLVSDILKMMKKFSAIVLLSLFTAGCAYVGHHKVGPGSELSGIALSPYSGPRAKVIVADFDIKAPKATTEVGLGLREIMVNALVNSNRFLVAPRQTVGPAVQDADLIISTAVTEFEPQASGGSAGVGGGGGSNSGAFGGLLGTALNKAHIVLEIRIINASTSEVLSSMRVQGQASEATGSNAGNGMDNWSLSSGLSAYANAPMEKAIRVCMIEALHYVGQAVPEQYYKYK